MSSHRQRVVEAVERFASRARPCESCGAAEAEAGWRAGGRYGSWCAACRRPASASRLPWSKPSPPPWRGPASGDAA